MSGHSKWHSIKHKKGAADAKRGKIFTKHAKLIAIAAQSGGDANMNPALRAAIDNSKADNMPSANIEKAIKKGTGEDKEGLTIFEVLYEGYGPAGTAILVETLTDNKNRTVASVKHAFSKNGGNMGAEGSVAWMFDKKGQITIDVADKNHDEVELEAIDAGADDLEFQDDLLIVYTDPNDLMAVKDVFLQKNYLVKSASLVYKPKNEVHIETEADAQKVMKLIDALEDDDDVNEVYSNFTMGDDLLQLMSAA